MIDPPRPEAIAAVRQSAGIQIKMTGDHALTAGAIAHDELNQTDEVRSLHWQELVG